MKKILTSTLLLAVLTVAMNVDTAFAEYMPPYEPPVEMHITVKWGNVNGTPQNINRVSFDGSLSVNDGDVTLIKALKFETHDREKDKIIQKENPIEWTSWIFNHWDGIRAKVVANPKADLTIKTDAGSIMVPIATLLTSPRATTLKFGDGREIVIRVNKIVTDPFYVYAIWGGPINTNNDAITVQNDVAAFAEKLYEADTAEAFEGVLESRPDFARYREDFSGALAFGNGARGKLVETILFEPGHGDQIIEESTNYIAWNSYIYNHFDGLFLKTQMDQRYPIDDTLSIKFPEIGWDKEYSLPALYVHGVTVDRIQVGDKTYIVAFVAVKKPFCDRNIHPDDSRMCNINSITPLPVKPATEPTAVQTLKVDTAVIKTEAIDVLTR